MTIYDIAKEAGVAASTVSRVINNKTTGVGEETRHRESRRRPARRCRIS